MSDFVEKEENKAESPDYVKTSPTSDLSPKPLSDLSSDPEPYYKKKLGKKLLPASTGMPTVTFRGGDPIHFTGLNKNPELPVWSRTDLPTDHPPKIIQQSSSGPGPSYTELTPDQKMSDSVKIAFAEGPDSGSMYPIRYQSTKPLLDFSSDPELSDEEVKWSDLVSELPEWWTTSLSSDPPKTIQSVSLGLGPSCTEMYTVITSPQQRQEYENELHIEEIIYQRLCVQLESMRLQEFLLFTGKETDKTLQEQLIKIKQKNSHVEARVEYQRNKLAHIKRRITEYDESRSRTDDKGNNAAPDSHGGLVDHREQGQKDVLHGAMASFELEQCEKQMFQPELWTEAGKISYRFRCPGRGVFQCKSTRLVFEMTQEADLLYRTVQWDESLLQSVGKTAAGLLFKIKCSESAAVSHLHLPHCEIMDDPLPEDLLSVVHITEGRLDLLTPLEITDTHVVVKVPHFCKFGIVKKLLNRFQNNNSNKEESNTKPVSGQVLLFLGQPNPKTQRKKLNILLLPSNIHLDEVSAQRRHSEHIEAPSTCKLIKDESYTLHCPQAIKIQPKKADFNLEFGPNYHPMFEIRLPTNTEEATLTVKDQTLAVVWEHDVDLTESRRGPPGESVPAAEKLRSVRADLVGRVSETILNQLLDKLLDLDIINDGEMQSVRAKPVTAEKARELIDTVWKKGNEASAVLIVVLRKVDPHLSRELKLG